jgi:hypothetical protein
MDSFFALLQRNVLDRRRWTTPDDLRIAIVTWMYLTRAFPESHSLRCGPGRCTAVGPVSFGQ